MNNSFGDKEDDMRYRIAVLLVLAAGIGLGWVASTRPIAAGAPAPKAAGPAWEYKVIERPKYPADYEKTLNQLGEQGWEYWDTNVVDDWTGEVGRTVTVLTFKRRKA